MMNSVNLIGRICNGPDIRVYEGKNEEFSIANFSVAVDRNRDETDFISCKAIGWCADFIEKYMHKGVRIGVSGRIQLDVWKDKDGNKKYSTYVFVERVFFADGKKEENKDNGHYKKNGRR